MTRNLLLLVVSTLLWVACDGCGARQPGSATLSPLAAGSEVPALVRVDHRGKVVALRTDQASLVYFYPKDGTPGCTKEACAFRDAWERYAAAGIRVIGVSSDSEAEHRKFAEEYSLPFSLIADPEHAWSDAFGVARHRLSGDRDARMSFLIDAQGKVAKVYPDVDPGVHAAEVLSDAKALGISK